MNFAQIGNLISGLTVRMVVLLFGFGILASSGCESPPQIETRGEGPGDGQPLAYDEIASSHNARVEHLQKTYAYGVLEIRWEDERGVHSEPQVDVRMWLDLPKHTALRIDKLGDVLFWVGSDENDLWMFDLLRKEDRTAIIRARDNEESLESISAFGLQPDSLLGLMALRPMPEIQGDEVKVSWAPDRNAWVVSGIGDDGRTRIFFAEADLRPIRVELLSDDGQVLLHSTLDRYASVSRPGVSLLEFPKQAMWIDIVDEVGKGFAKIHLNEMTANVEGLPFDRVFDLHRLIRSLRPARIDGQPSAKPAPSGQ
ncbi:MAG: hypothetical protein O7G85_08995 [Planctomycetota bacterium]|nr:hypothetical protein [Planctomycetota bacterium]